MHVDDALHGGRVGELDVVEEAAAQEGVGQLFFVVGGDEDQRTVLGAHQFTGLVAVELHAVEFAQQVVGKLDVGLVNLVDQQCHLRVGGEGLPEHAFEDVVVDVLHALATLDIGQLRIAQAADGVVFVQALLGLGGRFDVPLQQRHVQRLRHFLGQHGLAGAGFALDQEWALQGDASVDREHQILGGNVVGGAVEFLRHNKAGQKI